jgi:hypothetical protein
MTKTTLFRLFIGISRTSVWVLIPVLIFFHPSHLAFAADGDNAVFSFAALNGHEGGEVENENEVKILVDTDNAEINHLIFDIVDTGCFDIDGVGDPLSFPLSGQSVLGSEVTFTTASGDKGYDLASSNPFNTGAYSSLHFVTLITDKDDPDGPGCTITLDTDTAIFVNTFRQGTFADSYVVAANQPPAVTNPKVNLVDLTSSTVAPSAGVPVPGTLVTNVDVSGNFAFVATDPTDASVQKKANLYKRLDDDSWGYAGSPTKTYSISRSGTNMNYSWTLSGGNVLEYSTYYKIQYIATDDQGASSIDSDAGDSTYYFSTQADNNAPTDVTKASVTFFSDSDDRSKVISQISFLNATDNDSVANYYLWTKEYLIAKDIINDDGTRDVSLDLDVNETVSDEEFNVALRELVTDGNFLGSMTYGSAGGTPYFRITGDDVDRVDDNGTPGDLEDDIGMISDSLMEDVIYLVAADGATDVAGTGVSNFGDFMVVAKIGDMFGAQTTLDISGTDYNYIVGDGSLDVWDTVYTYRNIIGLSSQYPVLKADMLHSDYYQPTANYSISGATAAN